MNAQNDAPALFLSHGSPMVAIERGPYQDALATFGREVRPSAILAISAHWGSSDTIAVSGAGQYQAIHDFGGFPPSLYALTYSPPGSPALAKRIVDHLNSAGWKSGLVDKDGLDHGVWIPLRLMYPEATIPVVQLSVPLSFSAKRLYELGRSLAAFRAEDVLIFGSGGIVHNLLMFRGGPLDQPIASWAREFDDWFAEKLKWHDVPSLLRYEELAPSVRLAVPTNEHFAPVFIVLGAASEYTRVESVFEGFQYGAISLRSFAIA